MTTTAAEKTLHRDDLRIMRMLLVENDLSGYQLLWMLTFFRNALCSRYVKRARLLMNRLASVVHGSPSDGV